MILSLRPTKLLFIIRLLLALLVYSLPAYAQINKVDSLSRAVISMKDDSNKVAALNSLANTLSRTNPGEGIKWAKDAHKLAVKIKWEKGEAAALIQVGNNSVFLSDFNTALKSYEEAEVIFSKSGNRKGTVRVIISRGRLQFMQAQYPEAMASNMKALKIAEDLNDEELVAQCNSTIGSIYFRQGKMSDARTYYFKARELYGKRGNEQGLGLVLSNLGAIALSEGEYDSATTYLAAALAINERLGSMDLVGMNIANLAGVYQEKKQYNRSLVYSFRSFRMNQEMGDRNSIGIDEMNIGITYLKAVLDNQPLKPDSLMPSGKATAAQMAVSHLLSAKRTLIEVSGDLNALSELYANLSMAYYTVGEPDLADKISDTAKILHDSVFSIDNKVKIAELQTARANAEKEKQVKLNKITLAKKRNETIFFSIGIVLLVITVVFVGRERRRSDKLLLNILPEEVAKELKKKGSTTAQHYNNVTVLFTDFVNFTSVGERLSPQALVDELHACFKAFDEIISRHNIEKIKTVGDAYLAVSGLPVADPDHARNIIAAALEITAFIKQRKIRLDENAFDIRIGINSGSVVAGIVGVKKFAYDIWGDTVNIAARMEQASEPGKINISEATYELVKTEFHCEFRGELEVKNKGKMAMYFVEG